ncbi:MAG: CCA tRNA nucleotidyltransferase [Planctomycetota bacterium]
MVAVKLEPERMPAPVRALAARLRAAGGRSWLVGGTVRDLLLGLDVRDWDLATDLHPAAAAAALPEADRQDERFGALRIRDLPWPVVVTTLRTEADYRDHRHPDRIAWVDDPAADAVRRDFTVNAIYCDTADGALLDPTGGLEDLRARILRTIGEPSRRFEEDPLRLLRLQRFAARLDAAIAQDTATAARAAAPRLAHLSAERVFAELTDAFTGHGRGRALRQMVDCGVAAVLLPEVAAMDGVPQPPEHHPEGDVLTHTCLVLDQVPAGARELAWCAVLHDIGKPPTFSLGTDRIRFDGHDVLSARMADAVLTRLRAPRALIQTVTAVCRDHIRIASILQMRPRRRERWLRDPLFPFHLAFHRADCLGSHGNLSIYETVRELLAALPPLAKPLLSGADALALGVAEGPMVGELLRQAQRALDDGDDPAPTREQALAVLARLVAAAVKP